MTARPDGTRHHTELLNGTLTPRPPQRSWHSRVVTALTSTLMNQAPAGMEIERDMTLRLDSRNHLEPDLLATPLPYDAHRTWYAPSDVRLVVEVVSPESAHRDRTVKPRAYAKAGIPHYWRVEDEKGSPVVHVYELDAPTSTYAPVTIARDSLKRPVPFPVSLDLAKLTPPLTRP
ncbi:Uma2 family endonuclease [Streptomyces albidoflavus]